MIYPVCQTMFKTKHKGHNSKGFKNSYNMSSPYNSNSTHNLELISNFTPNPTPHLIHNNDGEKSNQEQGEKTMDVMFAKYMCQTTPANFFGKDPTHRNLLLLLLLLLLTMVSMAYAGPRIPGTDASDQLEAAGTVLRIVDTALFKWGARLFSGISILSAGYNLKEQRFGVAIVCIIAAIILGTAPVWVENIFSIGGGNGIFN